MRYGQHPQRVTLSRAKDLDSASESVAPVPNGSGSPVKIPRLRGGRLFADAQDGKSVSAPSPWRLDVLPDAAEDRLEPLVVVVEESGEGPTGGDEDGLAVGPAAVGRVEVAEGGR